EDGIRDGHVTGVQTCALPILLRAVSLNDRRLSRLVSFSYVGKLCVAASIAGASTWIASAALIGMRCRLSAILAVSTVVGSTVARSEERRVGKECRRARAREAE